MRRIAPILLGPWLVLGLARAQQQDFSKVEIKATPVAGSVHMLQGAGGNIAVSVGPDGLLMVDDQFAPLSDRIRAAMEKLGPGKLKFVLNTHWHGDHTGGNPVFGREAPIIAHENVRRRLSTPQHPFGRVVEPIPKEGWPVITFDASLDVHFRKRGLPPYPASVVHHPSLPLQAPAVLLLFQATQARDGGRGRLPARLLFLEGGTEESREPPDHRSPVRGLTAADLAGHPEDSHTVDA